jgi:dynein heavy chain
MQEAKSNIEFLQILKEPCDELDKTISPSDIPEIIPSLLQNVRIIWLNSPYFNTR